MNFAFRPKIANISLTNDIFKGAHGMDRGQRPPPPKLGPPKTLGPPTHRDSRGPPTKLHGHVKGNKVPSRETSHFF